MHIGMTLPTMVPAEHYDRSTLVDWCRAIDNGPFYSLSCGERITYHNQEMLVTLSAAAALTERVRIFATLFVLPLHGTAMVAKQMATLDVVSNGRLTVGVGVGGREHDFKAAERSFEKRHARMDQQVADIRAIWSGSPAFDGADPVGPPPVQQGGPPILAGVMGAKPLARVAKWADGMCGQSMDCNFEGFADMVNLVHQAWSDAGRSEGPYISSCFWYGLGSNAKERLHAYTLKYAEIFGPEIAQFMADAQTVDNEGAMLEALNALEEAGCDEVVLVPTSSEMSELDRTIEALAKR